MTEESAKEQVGSVFDVIDEFLDAFGEPSKYIRRAMLVLKVLSEMGWMRYSEIKRAFKELKKGYDISDSRLQELLKKLIKNGFIYKVQGGERTVYYIISEKGLRILQAMSLPLPPPFPPHVSYFPASDPFTTHLTALIVDAKATNRVLSLRGVRENVLKGLGQYEKMLDLMLNVAKGDSDDISSVKSRLSMLDDDKKVKFREEFKNALEVAKEVAEVINASTAMLLKDAGLYAFTAYYALSEVEKSKPDIGIDYVIIYVKPDDSDTVRLVLYRYSTLTVATVLLSTLGLELVKPFTNVLYIEGSLRAIGILNKILEALNEQYKHVKAWNIIAEELADSVDCCPEQAYEYIFRKESLILRQFKPKSTIVIIDESFTRKTLEIDLSKLVPLSGENTVVLAKGNIKLVIAKPTTLIEVVEGSNINITVKVSEFNKVPLSLVLLAMNKKLDEKDIFLKIDANRVSVMRPPLLVKRTYGKGHVESKILLSEECSAAKLYYDKNLFTEPHAIVNKIVELAEKSGNRDNEIHLHNIINEFLLIGKDDNDIFSCRIRDGMLLRGNKIKINIINSNNIWLKLYIINTNR